MNKYGVIAIKSKNLKAGDLVFYKHKFRPVTLITGYDKHIRIEFESYNILDILNDDFVLVLESSLSDKNSISSE